MPVLSCYQLLLTSIYSSLFNFPLTLPEIKQQLIGPDFTLAMLQRLDVSNNLKLEGLEGLTSQSGLYSAKNYQIDQVAEDDLSAALKQLVKAGYLVCRNYSHYSPPPPNPRLCARRDSRNQVYFPAQFDHDCSASWLKQRRWSENLTEVYQAQLEPIIKIASRVSGIKAVAVTGSLAAGNPHPNDDIDLLVVAQPHQLWLARAQFLYFLRNLRPSAPISGQGLVQDEGRAQAQEVVQATRQRAGQEPEVQVQWCANVWLDGRHLAVPPNLQNLITAHEVCQAQWLELEGDETETHEGSGDKIGGADIADRINNASSNIELQFLQANQWVQKYLPRYYQQRLAQAKAKKGKRVAQSKQSEQLKQSKQLEQSRQLLKLIQGIVNYILFLPQAFHLRCKQGIPWRRMKPGQAYFHKRDSAQWLLTRFERRVAEVLH